MVRVWDAEVVVDADLARRLVGQFPKLRIGSLRPLAEGWDRAVWLVNEEWVFGFPRRVDAVPGIAREMTWLPLIAPLLPLSIPKPAFLGSSGSGFPWPFFGSAFLPGREVCDATVGERARIGLGLEIASFLRHLHSSEVARTIGARGLPLDPNQRANTRRRVVLTRDGLRELEHLRLWRAPASVSRLLEQAERLRPSAQPLVVAHGDLHFRHLLVHDGRVSGVIDWVDLCRADAAVDLQLVWSFIPPSGREQFLSVYGPVTEEQLLRARVLALSLSAALARYGHLEGMASIEREAIAGLELAATD